MPKTTIFEQLRRNAVALISLAVAVTSLGYNTWRNEHSERNRNLRFASFELLLKLGELEDLVFSNYFDCNAELRGSIRTGWTIVRTIDDLAHVLDEDGMPQNVAQLDTVWEESSPHIDFESAGQCRALRGDDQTRAVLEKRVFAIRDAIDVVRADARAVLYDLE